jgi:hypothetical protein
MLACMLQRSGMQPVATAGMQAAIRFGEEEGRCHRTVEVPAYEATRLKPTLANRRVLADSKMGG